MLRSREHIFALDEKNAVLQVFQIALFFSVSVCKAAARHLDRKSGRGQEVEKIRRLAVGTRRRQPYCSLDVKSHPIEGLK